MQFRTATFRFAAANDAVPNCNATVRNSTDADYAELIDALNQAGNRLQDFEVRFK